MFFHQGRWVVPALISSLVSSLVLTASLNAFADKDSTNVAQTDASKLPLNKQAPGEPPAMNKPETNEVKGSIKMARVYFVSPKEGDKVKGEFTAKFGVEGMKVAPAGEMTPGSGHFHVLIDTPMTPKGEVIPMDDKHMHFGKGQTEAKLKLTPGPHSLTLLFADGTHRSYGEAMSQTIQVTVEKK